MRLGQRAGADDAVQAQQLLVHLLDVGRALPVAQLAPVVLPLVRPGRPAKEGIARRLHQPLARDDALSMVRVHRGAEVGLEH